MNTPHMRSIVNVACGQKVVSAVRDWLKTLDGRDWLEECGLTPEGVDVDHVISRKGCGGKSCIYNLQDRKSTR